MINKKVQSRITVFLIGLVLLYQSAAPVYAIEVPQAPDKPSTPTIDEQTPQAPETPESMDEFDQLMNERKSNDDSKDSSDSVSPSPSPQSNQQSSTSDQPDTTQDSDYTTSDNDQGGDSSFENNTSANSSANMPGDSELETGDATSNLNLVNNANSNTQVDDDTADLSSGEVELSNQGNGSDSNNDNSVDLSNDSLTVQDNDADIDNNLAAASDTGNNQNSENTGGKTTTETGDANTIATVITTANTNANGVVANEFNVVDDYNGDIILDTNNPCASGCQAGEVVILSNESNGSGSENTNQAEVTTSDQTFQTNDANVENNIILEANSGDNTSNDNTGEDTSIETGDANVVANVANFLNTNLAGNVIINTVNVMGDLVGDIIAPDTTPTHACDAGCSEEELAMLNSGNGSYSDNSNSFQNADESQVVQDNDAQIGNNLDLATNTGDNQAADNTGGNNSIDTGESNIEANVMNIANQNVSGGDWWIVLVNQAGNWIGQIVGAPEGAQMAGSEGTQFVVNSDGSITIANENNGSNSQNQNSVNQESDSTIVQNNNANLQNNIQVNANTGGNEASRNTGGDTSIETGDANILVNLINFVNMNVAGDSNVMITVVNVFGSWLGDFVAPGQEKQATETLADSSTPEIGGYSDTTEGGSSQTDSQSQESTTTSSNSQETIVYNNSTSYETQGENSSLRVTRNSRVLGQSKILEEKMSDSSEAQETSTQAESTTQGSKKVRIKLTWPAIITSILGLAYAGIKSRSLFWA